MTTTLTIIWRRLRGRCVKCNAVAEFMPRSAAKGFLIRSFYCARCMGRGTYEWETDPRRATQPGLFVCAICGATRDTEQQAILHAREH